MKRICARCLVTIWLSFPLTAWSVEAVANFEMRHFNYEEFDENGHQLDQEQGWIPGLQGEIKQGFGDWRTSGYFSYFDGNVDYASQTQAGQPFKTHTDEKRLRTGLTLERTIHTAILPEFSLFNGLSYSRWERDIKGRGGVNGLLETYKWWEVALGLTMPIESGLNRESRFEFSLFYTVDPGLEVELPGFEDPTLDLGERFGLRFRAKHTWWTPSGFGYTLGVFVEGWSFGRSDDEPLFQNGVLVGTVHEPRSETRDWGLLLSVSQRF